MTTGERAIHLDAEALVISRAELLALGTSSPPQQIAAADRARLGRHTGIMRMHTRQVVVTRVGPGEIRRADAWLSPAGLVAQSRQGDDDTPAPVVSTPPTRVYEALARIIGLRPEIPAALDAAPRSTFDVLVDDIVNGANGDPDQQLMVLDWVAPGAPGLSRWVVDETRSGRRADLAVSADEPHEVHLVPASALTVSAAVFAAAARALAR